MYVTTRPRRRSRPTLGLMNLIPPWESGGGNPFGGGGGYDPTTGAALDPFGQFAGGGPAMGGRGPTGGGGCAPFCPGQPGYVFEGSPEDQTFFGRLHRFPQSAAELYQWAIADQAHNARVGGNIGGASAGLATLASGTPSSSPSLLDRVTAYISGLSSTEKAIGALGAGALVLALVRQR